MSDAEEDSPRRFDIELFIVHPTQHPKDISRTLNLVAHSSHAVGEPRRSAKGKPLPGAYTDTHWRHRRRHTVDDQWFADEFARFVENLKSRSEALAKLQGSGGMATVIVQFLGEGFFGDEIGRETLSTIVELGLSLEIEVFAAPRED